MYIIRTQSDPNGTVDSEANMPPIGIDQMSDADRLKNFEEDHQRLIMQQNARIEEIENAYHITKIMYLLLPQNRYEIQKILLTVPEFETSILTDLELKFKQTY